MRILTAQKSPKTWNNKNETIHLCWDETRNELVAARFGSVCSPVHVQMLNMSNDVSKRARERTQKMYYGRIKPRVFSWHAVTRRLLSTEKRKKFYAIEAADKGRRRARAVAGGSSATQTISRNFKLLAELWEPKDELTVLKNCSRHAHAMDAILERLNRKPRKKSDGTAAVRGELRSSGDALSLHRGDNSAYKTRWPHAKPNLIEIFLFSGAARTKTEMLLFRRANYGHWKRNRSLNISRSQLDLFIGCQS